MGWLLIRVDRQHEPGPAGDGRPGEGFTPGAGNNSNEASLLSCWPRPTTANRQRCGPDRSKSALLLLAAANQQQQTVSVVIEGSPARPRPRAHWVRQRSLARPLRTCALAVRRPLDEN